MPPNSTPDDPSSIRDPSTRTDITTDKTLVVRILERYDGQISLGMLDQELHGARHWDAARTSSVLGSLSAEHVIMITPDLVISKQ